MSDFSDTVVIVTGGAQGIGRAIAEYLLRRNGLVVVADNDVEAGNELVEDHGGSESLLFITTDVCFEESVEQCVRRTVDHFGAIDGLVNNAGIASPCNDPVGSMKLDDWHHMLQTNLTGAFLMVKHSAAFLGRRRGAIVNVASTRALQSEANTEAYAASKGGLVSLTHALAVSFSGSIRVNAILPGWIDVSSMKKRAMRYDSRLNSEDHLQHPAGRVGVPDDIAALTAYLLSEKAAFITGQSFVVDGGMTRKMIYADE